MTINTDLLQRTITAIRKDTAHWSQSEWVKSHLNPDDVVVGDVVTNLCGTTMCMAGHAMVQSGEWEVYVRTVADWGVDLEFRRSDTEQGIAEWVRANDLDSYAPHEDVARVLLGMTHEQSKYLFVDLHDMTNVQEFVDVVEGTLGVTL